MALGSGLSCSIAARFNRQIWAGCWLSKDVTCPREAQAPSREGIARWNLAALTKCSAPRPVPIFRGNTFSCRCHMGGLSCSRTFHLPCSLFSSFCSVMSDTPGENRPPPTSRNTKYYGHREHNVVYSDRPTTLQIMILSANRTMDLRLPAP